MTTTGFRVGCLTTLLIGAAATAQEARPGLPALGIGRPLDQEKMQANFEAFLANPWLERDGWICDWEQASAAAKAQGRPILAYVTQTLRERRADERFEQLHLASEAFAEWAKQGEAVLFVHVRTGLNSRANWSFDFGAAGFPFVAVLDANGRVLLRGTHPHYGSTWHTDVPAISRWIHVAADYAALARRVGSGEEVDPCAWYMARLRADRFGLDEARQGLQELELAEEERSEAEHLIWIMALDLLRRDLQLSAMATPERRQEIEAEVDQLVYRAFKDGRRPDRHSRVAPFFDEWVVRCAIRSRDHETFFDACDRVRSALRMEIERLQRSIAEAEAAMGHTAAGSRDHEQQKSLAAGRRRGLADRQAFLDQLEEQSRRWQRHRPKDSRRDER